ncbi:MAG: Acetyl-CoA hydrolase/transferase [Thermoanaerobacterales bacterium 50_218]|nr:MAG: Acetyl-CoA hydrolase/transferase [Thermoanaerobacterales bacterium 50_218]HAA90175.1 4-hydroxybutyrate CoA-transferase [Peptococcaceae bacterium]
MNWKEYYQSRTVSADEAVKVVKSGDRVVLAHACGEPQVITEALVDRADELENVEIVHMVAMGKARYCQKEYASSFRHNSLFVGSTSREAVNEGRADYTPVFFHEIPGLFRDGVLPVDVAMVTTTPPDKHGFVSLGISVDYTKQAVFSAKTVIAEVNPNMPRTGGDSVVHVTDIDYFVPVEVPLIELAPPKITEVERAIGNHVASLIRDGDCLQLGIGAIPDAVLSFLKDKKDLGIHSEMISDGVMHLVEEGVITCRRKTFRPGKIVITFAMGTRKFYEWLDGNPMVEFYTVDFTNDPFVIAQNDNMVSINSAIAVDLMGQVAADMLGTRQFSGVGGQVDFVRGAARSKGGRSIIAMPATAAKGKVSRIVAALDRGQAVTTSRNDVDYVVTEYGIAHLKGKTIRQRAEALLNIAAPQFRDQIWQEFKEIYGI